MIDRNQLVPTESTQFAKKMSAFATPILAAVLGMFGVVLLVAGKTTAGSAFVCSALILLLPLHRLTTNMRLASWLRAAVIAVLCILAIRSVANTDIVPDQELTGWKFLDQVAAIFRRFRENVFGRT